MSFSALPKVELHLHLEGAAAPAFIRGLAQEKGMDLPGVFDENGNYSYRDFVHFLRVYEAATAVLTGPEEFYRLTRAVLEESAQHGVIYTEAFLSPEFCGGGDLDAWRDYLSAIETAAAEMEREAGITLRGIVTPIRHLGPEKAKASAICAAETVGDFITGMGIGGDESVGKLVDFAYSFDMAREAGLRLTAHAGEWGGAASVRDALELGVERIGHGVQAIEDADLVKHLAETGVVLECCPGSNVFLGAFPSWETHPIAKLMEAGVKVTVSTDDPPFFHTDMSREYAMLSETFGFDESTFHTLNQTAANAAFCDKTMRADILNRLESKS